MLDPATFQERTAIIVAIIGGFTAFNTLILLVLARLVGQIKREKK